VAEEPAHREQAGGKVVKQLANLQTEAALDAALDTLK